MCGICGIIKFNNSIDANQLLSMTRVLRHRGPDDEGFLLADTTRNEIKSFHHDETIDNIKSRSPRLENSFNANLGFGFRRLSILDLSEKGHQPMQFEEAGLWIVFNGEIYNYLELREELKQYGYKFISNTDTEVILKAYHKWGDDCVHKFNGMWAFALWDSAHKKLFCSRDRFGIKPFYYFFKPNEQFLFASELKSILQIIKTTPDQKSLFVYFAYGYSDHDEKTFFTDIQQLRGGHNLIFSEGKVSIYRYYNLKHYESNNSFEKAKEKFRELLFDAVKIRLRSDVPLGYALSGGIDSSSIVGIASKLNEGSNNIFSMIYPGNKIDESFYIKKVIEKLNINYNFVSPQMDELIDDFDSFINITEQPFTGLSHYGNYRLRKLIKSRGVTVSLEGQGADEIVTGYYDSISNFSQSLLRNFKLFSFYKLQNINHFVEFRKLIIEIIRSDKVDKRFLRNKFSYIDFNKFDSNYFINNNIYNKNGFKDYLNRKLYEQLIFSSIPTLLTFADKNSMAFSVESRFPFLDYRLVEYSFSLPSNYKVNNDTTKYILRESMKNLIPKEVYMRKDKIGFEVPVEKFNTSAYRNYFLMLLNDIDTSDFDVLEKQKFLDSYKNNPFDWKFWKVASVIFWYNKFHMKDH